jgi:Domain of unknown function (DUF4198)
MRMLFRPLLLAFAALPLVVAPGFGHEFWIEPEKFQVESGDDVVAHLRNGQKFSGVDLAFFDHRAVRFEILQGGVVFPYQGRMGDIPALRSQAKGEGLMILVHQTAPSTLKYKDWDSFAAFASHKDIPDFEARHVARNLPRADFFESYTRYAKALIGVGDASGQDQSQALEIEFVAGANPYTDGLTGGFPLTLLYQGAPRAGTQVEVFERAPTGDVQVFTVHTDDDGQATIPVRSGHDYLLDAVIMRPAPEGSQAVWDTHWASLTFRYP